MTFRLFAATVFAAGLTLPILGRAEPESPTGPQWAFNAGLTSNYVSRGFTQTWGRPALQGGVDLSLPSGVYLGTWASTLSRREFRDGPLEWDVYGGYSGSAGDWGYTLGLAYYAYPGSSSPFINGQRYDYGEIKLGLTHGAWQATLYRSFTKRWFGTYDDARGSMYLDLGWNPALPAGLTLQLHAGAARIAGHPEANWRDAKVGVTGSLAEGWTWSVAVTRAWDRNAYWTGADFGADREGGVPGKRLGATTLAAGITRAW